MISTFQLHLFGQREGVSRRRDVVKDVRVLVFVLLTQAKFTEAERISFLPFFDNLRKENAKGETEVNINKPLTNTFLFLVVIFLYFRF